MFRSGTALYRDTPYEHDTEFFQDVPYAQTRVIDQDAIVRGALIGAAAGLAAGFVMMQFQKLWAVVQEEVSPRQTSDEEPKHRRAGQQERSGQETDDATVKLANRISESVFDHKLTHREKKIVGPAMHYGFAVAMGAAYGALAEVSELITAGFGTFYGTLVFIGADEVAVPALDLSPFPQNVSLDKHAYGWASHVVYGAALEGSRRVLSAATR
jgi:uncharacterized membrane protein YagU involved in acid resistance